MIKQLSIATALGLALVACDRTDKVDNEAPVITISSVEEDAVYAKGDSFEIAGMIVDKSEVDVYTITVLAASPSANSFSFSKTRNSSSENVSFSELVKIPTTATEGEYTVKVTATDEEGNLGSTMKVISIGQANFRFTLESLSTSEVNEVNGNELTYFVTVQSPQGIDKVDLKFFKDSSNEVFFTKSVSGSGLNTFVVSERLTGLNSLETGLYTFVADFFNEEGVKKTRTYKVQIN